MAIVSTVPGAVACLQTHLSNVALANPTLNIGVYLGPPVGNVANNYLMWESVESYVSDYAYLSGGVLSYIKEDYDLSVELRAWAGNVDPIGRLDDAYTMLNGVINELGGDMNGGGALSPPGDWHVQSADITHAGPLGQAADQGWGVLMSITVMVRNVRINVGA